MLEIAVFQNGTADRPSVLTPEGIWVFDGTLEERNESTQRETVAQVRQGILADQLGFNYIFFTEHHFQPEGAEHSPNPLFTEMAIAARTSRLRLGQLANILSWWHPLRIAEQAAMLDVLSGGRLEFGIGRGYQNRETESLGGHYGTTNQDQERNRAYFEEAFAIIRKAWSQPSFSHQGEFFTLPPSYTKWHHAQTIAYFKRPEAGYAIDRALHLGPPDMYSAGPPVMASTTTLRELQLFPRPLQQPFPQVWQPVASPRSIKWAARHGINCFQQLEMNKRLKQNVEIYYEECAKHGWPDRLERGPFKFGWDADKRRGYSMTRYVHLLPPGKEKADRQRYLQAIETEWDYFAPFGTQSAALTDIGEEPLPTDLHVTGELLYQKEIAIIGGPDEVIEKILRIKETVGYDDFLFNAYFDATGYTGPEMEEQMRIFAADCLPQLAEACGGLVQNPPLGPQLEPAAPLPAS